MSNEPLVSVITPTYNRPEHLREAIGSILQQTYNNIELIIVDDHSSPPAREALTDINFSDIYDVKIIRHRTNRGANAARNTAIKEASGDYIALLDDDDVWLEEKIEKQLEVFRDTTDEVGVVFTGLKHVNTNDEIIGYSQSDISGDLTKYILTGGKTVTTSSLMVRRKTVEEGGLFDEECPLYQDKDWLLQLSLCCEFESIPDPLAVRRMESPHRISEDYELKRDAAIPYWIEKYRPLAAEYGWICERKFMAHMTLRVGRSAVKNKYFSDARKYLLKSITKYPFQLEPYQYLLVALGGSRGYSIGLKWKKLQRKITIWLREG